MHELHNSFPVPSNMDIPIWRYIDFAKFVHMLDTSTLHFARVDRMSDPFEGTLSAASLPHLKQWFMNNGSPEERAQSFSENVARGYYRIKMFSYVNCWHMNEFESVAMWNLYSDKGVAIQSTYTKLCESFTAESPKVYVGEVEYKDYNRDPIDFGSTNKALVTKRKSFEHERELRAALLSFAEDVPSSGEDSQALENVQPLGIYVPVDLGTLIVRVAVSPGRPDWFRELIARVMNMYTIQSGVTSSSLDESPYLM